MSSENASVSPETPAKKKDRSTVPMLAVLAACVASAYGYGAESALWRWQIPLALVVLGIAFAFWPRREGAAS